MKAIILIYFLLMTTGLVYHIPAMADKLETGDITILDSEGHCLVMNEDSLTDCSKEHGIPVDLIENLKDLNQNSSHNCFVVLDDSQIIACTEEQAYSEIPTFLEQIPGFKAILNTDQDTLSKWGWTSMGTGLLIVVASLVAGLATGAPTVIVIVGVVAGVAVLGIGGFIGNKIDIMTYKEKIYQQFHSHLQEERIQTIFSATLKKDPK